MPVFGCTHGLDSSGKPVKFLKLGDFLILRELYLVFLQTNFPLSHSGVQVHLQVLTGTCPRSPSESSGLPRERELWQSGWKEGRIRLRVSGEAELMKSSIKSATQGFWSLHYL